MSRGCGGNARRVAPPEAAAGECNPGVPQGAATSAAGRAGHSEYHSEIAVTSPSRMKTLVCRAQPSLTTQM